MIRRMLSRLLATRHVRIPADELHILDAEDHGPGPTDEERLIQQIWEETRPTPTEQAIIAELRATPLKLQVTDDMRERAMARFRDQCLADIATQAPRPVFTEVGDGVFTADELDDQVAAYEADAAKRFRNAGVTWPTNPATVGIARYDDKAGKA